MLVVGTHEEDPSTQAATIRLWEWESGIPIPPRVATTGIEESPSSPTMNATTATTTDAMDANATGASDGEQQQMTPTLPPLTPLLE
jgi:hypothetical protein